MAGRNWDLPFESVPVNMHYSLDELIRFYEETKEWPDILNDQCEVHVSIMEDTHELLLELRERRST